MWRKKQERRILPISRNKKGILLLEVVIALTIAAVGMTVVSRSFATCIRALENTSDYNMAVLLADEVFWGLETKEPDNWPQEGKFEKYPSFSWTQESKDREDLGLKDVKVKINWKRRNRVYTLTISTFLPYEKT